MVVKSATYEAMTCKRTYVSPSLEVITEEEELLIVCTTVKVDVYDEEEDPDYKDKDGGLNGGGISKQHYTPFDVWGDEDIDY